MLRKASKSPPPRRPALPDAQELERRGQVRGLMELWSKVEYRFEDLQHLRKVRLSNRGLTDEDLTALCAVLDEKMVQVSELDVVGNRLHDQSLVALVGALRRGAIPYVTSLQISRNRFTDEGLPVYKFYHLGMDQEDGGTPLCPFDCKCCF